MSKSRQALGVVRSPTESPEIIYGRLLESAHISGYSFERLCDELEYLLADGRWRQVGPGYDDSRKFLATIDLSPFNLGEHRPKLVKRIKELEPSLSQRAIAKAVGVDESTVRADLGAGNPARPSVDLGEQASNAGNPALSGRAAAKLVQQRSARIARDKQAEANRIDQAKTDGAAAAGSAEIRPGDFRQVLADLTDVDAVITDPPYGREHLPLLGDLAAWADKALHPDGILVVLLGQFHLPEAYELLAGHRPYRWTACYLTPGGGYVAHNRRVQTNWKPLLVYGGGERFADIIHSEGDDHAAKDRHRWGQDFAAFQTIIDRFTRPGHLVADPFAGSGTTLLAAKLAGRRAVGAEIDEAMAARCQGLLA